MYSLAPAGGYQFDGNPSPFVFEILQTSSGLAAITDNGILSILDPFALRRGPINSISTRHSAIKLLRDYQAQECSTVCTAAEDGRICIWDLRQGSQVAQLSDGPAGIQALTCCAASHTIAAGTDFENHQASVSLW